MDPKGGRGFVTTAWSVIQEAQDLESEGRREALGRLIQLYWQPVYWTIRFDWRKGHDDAADLTQARRRSPA